MIYRKEGDTSFRYQVENCSLWSEPCLETADTDIDKTPGERNLNIDRIDESESDIGDNPDTRGFVREKRGPRSQHAW